MPYYLSPLEDVASDLFKSMGRKRFAPVGADSQVNRNWIILDRGRALIWLETAINDPRLKQIVDDPRENLVGVGRGNFTAFVTERTPFGTTFLDAIVDIFMNPLPGRWNGLKPSKRRQRFEMWLGPGGNAKNLLWSQKAIVSVASKTFDDNFNRAAADLDGSTSSDGNFTWVDVDGTDWEGTNNAAEANQVSTGFKTIRADADLDTDDHYAEFTIGSVNGGGGQPIAGPIGRFTGGDGYGYEEDLQGGGGQRTYDYRSDANLDSGSASIPSVGDVLRVSIDGSSIEALLNGSNRLGPTTNTLRSGQLRTGMTSFTGNGNRDFQADDFQCADITVAGNPLAHGTLALAGVGI